MKITILGGGNMGGAMAKGLASGTIFLPQNITVVDTCEVKLEEFRKLGINAVLGNYDSLVDADIVLFALKPWLIKATAEEVGDRLTKDGQIVISIAAGITLNELESWLPSNKVVYRVIPNTAIAVKQSMTFIASNNSTADKDQLLLNIFGELGKALVVEEKLFSAVTALSSCGIAYAFRYIRAAMEGGVEMGIFPDQAKEIVAQTLRGAIELLEANNSHPEQEIDKVTTPGGITIKGLNEMEHAGFTSAVIKGLKASNIG